MTLSKDYYQEVQEAVRESGDAFMVHNPRLALRKALQAAIELNQLIEELNDLKANYPPEVSRRRCKPTGLGKPGPCHFFPCFSLRLKTTFFGGQGDEGERDCLARRRGPAPAGCLRPCSCGCDERDGRAGVGYLTGSDAAGNGFTIWIESEEVFQRLEQLLALE